jgi:3-oxoacyl-[acyl-carrier protein] reductase
MKRLENKRVLVTGSARGIGKAIARKVLQEGGHVFLADIRTKELTETKDELAHSEQDVHAYTADLSKRDDINRLVGKVIETWGRIDVLVNNAGIARVEEFLKISEESWDRTMAVNLKSVFQLSQAVARTMLQGKHGGAIVNTASTNGLVGEAGMAHYNASKAGVILLTKTMAIELAPNNIRANCVCPGFIYTDLTLESGFTEALGKEYLAKIPLNRYGAPEDVANVVAFLASDEASFVTGTSVIIDGGQLCHQ